MGISKALKQFEKKTEALGKQFMLIDKKAIVIIADGIDMTNAEYAYQLKIAFSGRKAPKIGTVLRTEVIPIYEAGEIAKELLSELDEIEDELSEKEYELALEMIEKGFPDGKFCHGPKTRKKPPLPGVGLLMLPGKSRGSNPLLL